MWEAPSSAGISSVPKGLTARAAMMAAVTVLKYVREPWGSRGGGVEGVLLIGGTRGKTGASFSEPRGWV